MKASPTASEKCARTPPLRPRILLQPKLDLGNMGTQLTSTTHLLGSCARLYVRVRSAERPNPNIAAADALDSPSGESWRAKLGAEQEQVSATSIRRVAVETVVMAASAVARHHLETRPSPQSYNNSEYFEYFDRVRELAGKSGSSSKTPPLNPPRRSKR